MTRTALIEAFIDAPQIVEVSPRAKTVPVTIRTELCNVSEQDCVLQGRPDNDKHFWHLLDQNHREVMRQHPRKTRRTARKKSDLHPVRSKTIAGGHSIHETQTLKLDASKLKDGETYTIRSEIWGHIAEASFIVVRPQKATVKKVAPKKATSAKKKATPKKATPAKKKAAPKKTAKK